MCKICIRNFNSPKNLPIETFFLFIKTCKFVSKDVCPIAWRNWQVWHRMICENVEWLIAANTKDFCCWQLHNHLQNLHLLRPYLCTVRYVMLNSTQHIAITRIGRESWANQLMSCDVISLFLSFTHPQSLGHFWREKSSFLIAKIQEMFWEKHF